MNLNYFLFQGFLPFRAKKAISFKQVLSHFLPRGKEADHLVAAYFRGRLLRQKFKRQRPTPTREQTLNQSLQEVGSNDKKTDIALFQLQPSDEQPYLGG